MIATRDDHIRQLRAFARAYSAFSLIFRDLVAAKEVDRQEIVEMLQGVDCYLAGYYRHCLVQSSEQKPQQKPTAGKPRLRLLQSGRDRCRLGGTVSGCLP
jgi:hypothetical protein